MKGKKRKKINSAGFSLLEIIVSLALFVIIIIIMGNMFSFAERSYGAGSNEDELSQNGRVSLDRMSREIRQTPEIISSLSTDSANPSDEITFQDGHDTSNITYIRYYLNNGDLMRSVIAYYFNSNPSLYVYWNSTDQFGDSPTEVVLEDRIVGEYFQKLNFWSSGSDLVNVSMDFAKGNSSLQFDTSVYPRN